MRLLDLLKRIEWSGYNGVDCCPECCGYEITFSRINKAGHKEGCELKAAIDQFSKAVTLTEFAALFTPNQEVKP